LKQRPKKKPKSEFSCRKKGTAKEARSAYSCRTFKGGHPNPPAKRKATRQGVNSEENKFEDKTKKKKKDAKNLVDSGKSLYPRSSFDTQGSKSEQKAKTMGFVTLGSVGSTTPGSSHGGREIQRGNRGFSAPPLRIGLKSRH